MVRETRKKEQARKQPERRKQGPKYAQNGRVAVQKSHDSRKGKVISTVELDSDRRRPEAQQNGIEKTNSAVPTTSNGSAMGTASRAPAQTAKPSVTSSSNEVKQQRNGSDRSEISSTSSSIREDIMGFYKDLLNVFVEVRDPSKPSSSSVDDQQASTSTDQPCSDLGHVVPYKKKVVDSEWQANFIKTQANFFERIVMGRVSPKEKDIEILPTSSEVERNPSVKASTSSETQTSDRVPPQQPPTKSTKGPIPGKISSKKAPEAFTTSSGSRENPIEKPSTSSGIQKNNHTSTQQPPINGTKTPAPSSTVITSTVIHRNAGGVKKSGPSEALPSSSGVQGNPSMETSTSSGIQNSNTTASEKLSTNGTEASIPEESVSSKYSKTVPNLKASSSIAPNAKAGPSKKAPEALATSSEVKRNPCVKASTSSGIQNHNRTSTQQPPISGTKAPAPSSTVNATVKASTLSRILHALRKPSTNGKWAPLSEEPCSSKDSALMKKVPILKTSSSIAPPESSTSKEAPEALPSSSKVNGNSSEKASTSSGIQNSNATAPVTPFTNGTETYIPEEPAPSKYSKKVSILKAPSSVPPNHESGPSEEISVALPTSSGVRASSNVKASTSSEIQIVKSAPAHLPRTNGTKAPVSEGMRPSLEASSSTAITSTDVHNKVEKKTGEEEPSEAIPTSSGSKANPSVKASTSSEIQNSDATAPEKSSTNGPIQLAASPSIEVVASEIAIIGPQNGDASTSSSLTNSVKSSTLEELAPSKNSKNSVRKAGEEKPSEALPTSSGINADPNVPTSSEIQNSDATAPEKPSTNGTEAPVPEEPAPSKYSALFKKVSILRAPSSNASYDSVVKIKLFKRSSVLFENLSNINFRAPISKGSNRPKRDRKARRIMDFDEFPVTERCVFAQRENRSKTVPIWELSEKYMNPVLPPRSKPFENPAGLHPDPPRPSPPPPSESGEEEILWDMEELDSVLQAIQLGAKPAPIQLAESPSIEVVPSEIAIIGSQNGDASISSSLTNGTKSSTPEEPASSKNSKEVSISTAPCSIAPNPEEVASKGAPEALPTSSGVNGNPIEKPSTSSETQTSDLVPTQQPPTNGTKDPVPGKTSSKKAPESLPASSEVDPSVKVFSSTRKDPEELYKAVFNALFEVRGNPKDDQQASTSTDQPCSDLGHVVPYKKKVVDSEWQTYFLKWNMDLFERLVNGRKNNGNEANGPEKATDSEAQPTSSGVKEYPIEKPSTSSEIQNPNGAKAPVSEGMRPSLEASSSTAITLTDILNKAEKKAGEEEPSEVLLTSSGVNGNPIEMPSMSSEVQNSDTTVPEKPSTNGTEAPVREGIHPNTPTPRPHSESGEQAVSGEMEELDNVLQEIQLEANHAPIQLAASPSSSRETFSPEKDVSSEIDIIGPQNGETSNSAVRIPKVVELDAAAKAFLKIKNSKRRQNETETAENSCKRRRIQAPKYVQNGRVAPPKSQVLENRTITGVLNQNTEVASKRSVETPQNESSHSSSNVPTTSNSSELNSKSSTIPTTSRPEISNLPVLDAPASSALLPTEAHVMSSNDLPLQAGPAPKPQNQSKDASQLPVSPSPKVIAKPSNKLQALLARKRQLALSTPEKPCSLPNSDENASTSNDISAQDKTADQHVLPVSSAPEVNNEFSNNIRISEIPHKKQQSTSSAPESSSFSLPIPETNSKPSNGSPTQDNIANDPANKKYFQNGRVAVQKSQNLGNGTGLSLKMPTTSSENAPTAPDMPSRDVPQQSVSAPNTQKPSQDASKLSVSSSPEVTTKSSNNIRVSNTCPDVVEPSSSLPRSKDNASSSNNVPAQVEPAGEPVFRKPMLPQDYSESQQRTRRERKSKVAFTPEPMGSKEDQRGTKRKSEVAPTQDLRTEPKELPRKKRAPTRGILEPLEQEESRKDKRGIIPPFGPTRKPFSFDQLPKETPQKDFEESENKDEEEDPEKNQKRSKKETKGRLKYVGKYWFPKMGKECQIEVPEWKEKEEVKMDEEERDEKDECVWSFPNETKMDQSAEDRLFEQIKTKYWFAIWRQFKGHIPYGTALQHLMENNFDLLESLENIDKCLEKVPQRFKDICVEQARQFVQFQKDHQKFHKKQKFDYPQRGISHSYEATDRRELQETTLRNYHIGEIDSLIYQIHRFYMPSEEIDCKVGCTCHDTITAELQFEPRFGCKNCTKHLRNTSEYSKEKLCLICQNYKELTGVDRPVKKLILDDEESRKIEAWNKMERDLAKKIDREEFEKLEKEDTLARWRAYELTEEEVEMLTFKRSSLMKTGQNIRPISKAQFNALDDEKKLEVFERIKAKLEPVSLPQFVTCKCKESGGITRYSHNSFPKELEELVRIIAETKTAEGEVDVEKAAEKLLEIEPLEDLPCPKGGSPLTKEERVKKRIEHFLKLFKKKDQIWKTPEEIAQAIAQTTNIDGAADLNKAAELLGEEPELVENFLKKYKKRNKIWKPWPKNSFHKFKPRKIVPNQNLPTPFSLIKSISRPEEDPSCIVEDHVATPEPESKHEAVEIKRAPSRVQTPMRRSIRMSMIREIESPEDVVEKDSSPEQDQNPKEAPDAPAPQTASAKRGRGRPKGSKYSGPFADSDQDSEEDQDFDRRSQDPDFKPKRSRKRL